MSIWDQHTMEIKIRKILSQAHVHVKPHHFGIRPFQTAYQIAIAFKRQFKNEFKLIGKPVGGKGTGQHNSLAQYIALELSKRIKHKKIKDIEGAFLYRKNLESLSYKDGKSIITSSSMQAYDLSLFRLKK